MNLAEIKGKYAIDGYLDIPKDVRLKIFDHVKQIDVNPYSDSYGRAVTKKRCSFW